MLASLCIFVFAAHAYYRITDDAVLEFYSRSRSLRQDPRARNAPLIALIQAAPVLYRSKLFNQKMPTGLCRKRSCFAKHQPGITRQNFLATWRHFFCSILYIHCMNDNDPLLYQRGKFSHGPDSSMGHNGTTCISSLTHNLQL